MHQLTRFILGALLALSAFAGSARASLPPGEQRAEDLIKILSAPADQQRSFVAQNFAQPTIDRRGLGDRVEFGITKPNGENLRFTVLLSPPPESKIAGFTLQPDESAAPPPAVAEADLPRAVGDFMQQQGGKGFSGAAIVAHRGQPIFAQAYGEADRAGHRANTLDTPFNLASDNKMFTAVLIAQLQQEGRLAWSDTVGHFLPDWPQADVRAKVTIQDLLTHTSGLGDY